MDLLYTIITNPFFWALIGIFGLLGASTVVTNSRAGGSRALAMLSGLFFVIGRLMLVLPVCPQPRFVSDGWHWVLGGLVMLAAGVFVIPGLTLQPLTAPRSDMKLYTRGLYSFVRNPFYLGEILLSLGMAILFRSVIGLLLVPVWWAGLVLHILIEEENMELALGPRYLEYKARVKGRIIPLPPFTPEPIITRYPFKNLVFKGGGMKGAAYAGVLETLDEYNLLTQIDRVSGASAGAITATLVSFRLPLAETLALMYTLDFSKVPQLLSEEEIEKDRSRLPQFLNKELERISGDVTSVQRLINQFGWHSSGYFYNWLKDIISQQCDGNGLATFADFHARGFRDLYIVGANVSRHSNTIFSFDTTPYVAVADAVRISMSIPLYFEAIHFDGEQYGQGDYYVDGGLLNNYPIQIFDAPKFAEDNFWFRDGINWETLGCYLFIPENVDGDPVRIKDLRDFVGQVFECYNVGMQIAEIDNNPIDQRRTIKINSCDVQPTDFTLKSADKKYQELVEEGRRATRQYLENYTNPAVRSDWDKANK